MLIKESRLDAVDNSGAIRVKCFHIFVTKVAKIGSLIMISIKTFRSGKKVKKGEVYKAIVVGIKAITKEDTGVFYNFEKNNAVLWKRKENSPVGTRVLAYIPSSFRKKGYSKIVIMSFGSF